MRLQRRLGGQRCQVRINYGEQEASPNLPELAAGTRMLAEFPQQAQPATTGLATALATRLAARQRQKPAPLSLQVDSLQGHAPSAGRPEHHGV